MAKGQLPVELLEVYDKNPSPHTVKQFQDALAEAHPGEKPRSGGAIGYALDRLILERVMERVGTDRPATYQRTGNAMPDAPVPAPAPRTRPRTDTQAAVERAAEEVRDEPPREAIIGKGPCGFCSDTKDVKYHLAYCPKTIKRGAGGLDWKCPCRENHHGKAADFETFATEVQNALDAGADVEDIEDLLRGIISEFDIKTHSEMKVPVEPLEEIEITDAEVEEMEAESVEG